MADRYHWDCPPCGRPPYPGPGGYGPGRPPYPDPWGPVPPGSGRPPYPGPWGSPGSGGPPPKPYPNRGGPIFGDLKGTNLAEDGDTQTDSEGREAEMDDLYMADMMEPEQMEEDWLYMKQLYPNGARKILPDIEEAADRLEYENSLMFDPYPDRVAVEQLVMEIVEKDQTLENDDAEIVQVMLLCEMHHRRWRYQRMNRRNG